MRHFRQLAFPILLSAALFLAPAGSFGKQAPNDQSSLMLKQVKQRLKQNQRYLKQAEKRGKAGDTTGLQSALTNYDRSIEGLNTAISHGQLVASPSQEKQAYERVQSATSKHIQVLENLLTKVPEQARSAIQHAIQVSQTGHNTALAHLQQVHAEQMNSPAYGRPEGAPHSEGVGAPRGMGGFPGAGGPMGGGMGMGHPGGGHPGR